MDHYAEIRNPVAYKFRIIKSHKLWKLILCAIYKYFGCSINLFEFYRHCNSIIQMKTSFSRNGAMNPSPGPLNTVLTLKKMNDLLWLAVLKPPKESSPAVSALPNSVAAVSQYRLQIALCCVILLIVFLPRSPNLHQLQPRVPTLHS